MAARFWVGGTGNWSDGTNHWSASSGGAPGATVPSSSDDATFDSNSGTSSTVTIDVAANANTITINKSDLTLTHSAGSTVVGAVTLTTGILNTNGQTCSWGSFSSNNSSSRTLTMGTSSITISGTGTPWNTGTATNMTVTSNTATVTLTNNSILMQSATGLDLNGLSIVMNGSGNCQIQGVVAKNFTRTGTAAKTDLLQIRFGNSTFSGTFTCNGNSAINRILVYTEAVGTQRTITAATVSCSNCDFMDIVGAGAGSWNLSAITGGSGDCGGNSGITFTTGSTQTATGASSFTWSTHGWTTRVPLPQDDVVINNAFSASQTVTADMPRLGKSITFGCTGSPTFTNSAAQSLYGSLDLTGVGSTSGTNTLTFAGRSSFTITSASVVFTQALLFSCPSGTYTFQDNLTTNRAAADAIRINTGTVIDNGKTVSISGNNGTFQMAGGLLTGTGIWSFANTSSNTFFTRSGGTISGSGMTIVISTAGTGARTFAGGGQTYGTLKYIVSGSTGKLTITGSNTFSSIQFSDATNARTLEFTAGTTTTISSASGWQVNGTSGKNMTVTSATAATHTISCASGNISSDYLTLSYSTATGGASFYAGANSTNVSGNSGWNFTAAPTVSVTGGSLRDMERQFYSQLVSSGYGTIEDLKAKYFISQVGGANPHDAERKFLQSKGATGNSLSEMWNSYLDSRGIAGKLSDKLKKFYMGYTFS